MAGLRRRFGPQRGVGSGSFSPRSRTRGNFPNPFRTQGALGSLKIPGIKIQVIPRVKFATFDRGIIKRNWNAINRNPMQRAGNLIRMKARGSIRRVRKYAPPAPPGSPPRSRWGSKAKRASRGGTPPFKMIYNVPTMMGTGQIIGMVGFNTFAPSSLPVPGLHELGGTARRRVRNMRRRAMTQSRDPQTGRFLPKSVLRGKQHGRFIMQRVVYPKRPFMRPALKKAIATGRIPQLWRHSLRRAGTRGISGLTSM